ncbi:MULTISPECIES: MBL fold metallo-hydrolase [Streptomycetaceae]|nr:MULTISPECIES: MBL fold metallo-hydrolase [Streptomycetaceae]MYS61414.1 MBL fold metallo-hydrolase [Streptomyces sp. SID5468]CCB77269.1 Predicted Zn-dependent hydrolase of beta-lactamase fold [Streptantibioticus cattleyicolor NRRL 8057 = DSM 46488]
MAELTIEYVGGPTAVIEAAGLRLLTDPTFDGPGEHPVGSRSLTKTAGPALAPDAVGPVDAVLLSHDQHPDNLDTSGRAFLARAPLVLSTEAARDRLGDPVRALPAGEWAELPRPDGGTLRITGVPAQHGPDGSESLVGQVTGFLLTGQGVPTVYVSGDNASLDVVRSIADTHGPVDVAVLFAGAARTPLVPDAYLTLTSEQAAEAARILGARQVVPLHFEHWGHFTQGRQTLLDAFATAGDGVRGTLRLLEPGERLTL